MYTLSVGLMNAAVFPWPSNCHNVRVKLVA